MWVGQNYKSLFLSGAIDLDNIQYRLAIVMTNTSLYSASEATKDTVSAFTTLDEMNGSNYGRINLNPGDTTLTRDDINKLLILSSAAQTYVTLGAGARPMAGILAIYDPNGTNNDTTNIPAAFLDSGFPKPAGGLDFLWTPDPLYGWFAI